MKAVFEQGDVFVVDREFYDAVLYLEGKEFIVNMLELIQSRKNQQIDLSANSSRFVTKVRYIVEFIHSHVKTCFQYFNNMSRTKITSHLTQDFSHPVAIHNEFHALLNTGVTSDIYKMSRGMLT